jgi:hypothetical protein
MPLPRVGDLEVAEDPVFERRSWRIERIGWVCMALVILAGLAGLLGSGPLGRGTHTEGALVLQYQRFARMEAPMRLELSFGADAVRDGKARVWIERRYLERVKLERVVPQPETVEAGAERLTYVFAAQPQGGSATFHLQSETFGRLQGRVGAARSIVSFAQIVYP